MKERDQIKTVFALTVDSAMSFMTKIQFIFRNRQYLTRKVLMLQLSDLFLFDSYSSILLLELGRIGNDNLYPMDPLAQPIRFRSGLKLGARNVARMYMCATFFMNVRSTYYGNQFSEATGCPTMTIDEFLAL